MTWYFPFRVQFEYLFCTYWVICSSSGKCVMLAPRQEVSVANFLDYINTRHFSHSLSGTLCHAHTQKRP